MTMYQQFTVLYFSQMFLCASLCAGTKLKTEIAVQGLVNRKAVSNILPSNCWYTKVELINAAEKFCMANKNVQTLHEDFISLIKYQQIFAQI